MRPFVPPPPSPLQLKGQLAKDTLAVQIDELEARVKHQESTVYALSDYIETKGSTP